MRPVNALACAFLLAAAPSQTVPVAAQPAATAAPAELAGLWRATRQFGPDARGPIVLRRQGSEWTADFQGRIIPVRRDGDVLGFALPDGQGTFRARLGRGDTLSGGQWHQPETPVGPAYATGIRFSRAGRNGWRGEVAPIEESFTIYLMLERRPDGTLGAFIRNPDRNIGVFFRADRLEGEAGSLRLVGRRPGGKSDIAFMTGAFDAEAEVLRLYFAARGGSYDFRREGTDSQFYPRGRAPGRYVYRPPLARADGWPVADLASVGIDRSGIEAFVQRLIDMEMDSVDAPEIHGVLIARHGKLVLEEYFHGFHRDLPHDTRSASKSLTATLVGAALKAGAPIKLSDPVYAVMNGGRFPEGLEAGKRAMTLEHLLTMSSGFFCDDTNPDAPANEDAMLDQREEPDFYRYTMRAPLDRVPGAKAVYCSADPNLALGMLSRATGEHAMDLFDRLLGRPLGIARHGWYLSPSLQPYGGGSARMLPRDFMKLGQLMLNGGTWQGRRILSRDFVRRASSPLYDLRRITYGYLWWGIEWPYKDRKVRAYFAGGNGGQGVMVVPELDLVVATYGGSYAARAGLEIQQAFTPRYILPAVREAGDRAGAPVVPAEFEVNYGR